MKTIKLIAATIMVIVGLNAKAQTDSTSINDYLRRGDEIISEINKFGMDLTAFPVQDPCGRGETRPPVVITIPDTAVNEPQDPWNWWDTLISETEDTTMRNVYWIHGLNGTEQSWKRVAQASESKLFDTQDFHARFLHSVVDGSHGGQTYLEDGGIAAASLDLRDNAVDLNSNEYPHTDKDFIIAHSQGGIVAREWLRNMEELPGEFPSHAHGLVTFGTPHAGAQILNNTRIAIGVPHPKLLHFFNEGCNKLAEAYIMPVIWDNFVTSLLASGTVQGFIQDGCVFGVNTIIPVALDNYWKPTTQDYSVGAPFLTQANVNNHPTSLSDYVLKVPVVQFYGVEEQPIMWKFFSSTLEMGTNIMTNQQRLFGYDKDDDLEIKVNKMKNEFSANYLLHQINYNQWERRKYLLASPGGIALRYLMMKQEEKYADAYFGAYQWLALANDYYISELVGARECTSVQVPKFIMDKIYWVYENQCSYKDNDGVVLAESAKHPVLVNTAQNSLNTRVAVRMERTNHDQMKNSEETKKALNGLYKGWHGRFFTTAERH